MPDKEGYRASGKQWMTLPALRLISGARLRRPLRLTLTHTQTQAAFAAIGELLNQRGLSGEIAICDGSAFVLQMAYSALPDDVECLVSSTHCALVEAMAEAGRRLDLPPGWLDNAVSAWLEADKGKIDAFPFGQYPDAKRPLLKVFVAKPQYVLAMKIEALRKHPQEVEDIATMAMALRLRSVDEMLSLHGAYFDQSKATPEMQEILQGIARNIQANTDTRDDDATPRP